MKTTAFLTLLLSMLALLACSTQETNRNGDESTSRKERSNEKVQSTLEEMDLETHGKVDRISSFRIESWRYIDDFHLIIEAARKEQYLVEFRQPCFGLSSAFQIGFTESVGGLTKFDRILVSNTGARGNEVCHISEIVRLMDRN